MHDSKLRDKGYVTKEDILLANQKKSKKGDCSLMVDEYRYVDNKIKSGLVNDADRLRYFWRYRDDCTTLNLDNFLQVAGEIYPSSLTLTQENDQLDSANVLDMVAEIRDGRVITEVYCKMGHPVRG